MAYCNAYELKLYGGFASSDNNDDELLAMLVPIAEQMIDSYCNRTFEYTNTSDASTSRIFDAVDDVEDNTLMLDKDLHSIRSITIDGVAISSDNYATEPRSDAPYWGITVLDTSSDSWDYSSDKETAIVVDGHWAYSQTVPQDIKIACVLLIEWLMKMRNSDLALTAPIIDAQSGVTIMPVRMPSIVVTILSGYKRKTIEGV